jgi:nitroreductase/dihydropteridine reductase
VAKIIEAINLAASSIGMQTYRVFVVQNNEIQKKLGEGSFNGQISESSHLLVFAAFDSINQQVIDKYISLVASERNSDLNELADFKNMISGHLLAKSDEENFIWSSKQAYIGLGTALIAAANLKIDSTPMEGFDAQMVDSALGLREKGLKSVVLLALGYRDVENDWNAKLKKVRLNVEEFATLIK